MYTTFKWFCLQEVPEIHIFLKKYPLNSRGSIFSGAASVSPNGTCVPNRQEELTKGFFVENKEMMERFSKKNCLIHVTPIFLSCLKPSKFKNQEDRSSCSQVWWSTHELVDSFGHIPRIQLRLSSLSTPPRDPVMQSWHEHEGLVQDSIYKIYRK